MTKRRIEKHDVVAARIRLEEPEGIRTMQFDLCGGKCRLRRQQGTMNRHIVLDHDNVTCAARRGFKPKGATAGKQVKADRPGEVLSQPVEQCFPQSVGRRPQGGSVRKAHDPAAPLATNNAHLVCLQARGPIRVNIAAQASMPTNSCETSRRALARFGSGNDHSGHALRMHAPTPGLLHLFQRDAFYLCGKVVQVGQGQPIEPDD